MRKPFPKPLKIALIAAGSLVGLLVIAAVILSIMFPPSKVKAIVLEQAGKKLQREVKVESAGLKFFPYLGVSLKGFEVANNPDSGFSKEPLFHLKELGVELSLKSIFKMSPVVSEIRVVEPEIRLEVLPDGRTSLDNLGGPKDTTTPKKDSVKPLTLPFPLTVDKIRITDGSFTYLDRKKGQNLSVAGLNEVISLSTDKKLENVETKGTLEIREIAISGSGMPVKKGGIHVKVSHDLSLNLPAATVTIRSVKASLQDVTVELTGSASNVLVTPDLALRLKSEKIDLASLLKEVPKGLNAWVDKTTLAGSTNFDLSVKGKLAKERLPQISGAIHLVGIGASVAGVPAKLESLNGTISLYPQDSAQGVKIQPFDLKLAGNPISLYLDANGLPKKPYLKALDTRGRIDLGAVSKLVPGMDVYELAGLLGFDVKGQGPLDPANPTALQIAGTASLEKISAKAPGLPDRVNVDGTASFANTAVGAKLAVVTGPTDVAVDAKVSDWLAMVLPKLAAGKVTAVTASVKSRQIDLDRLLPASDPNKPKEASKPLVIPALPNVRLTANVDAALVKAFGLQVTGVKSATTFAGGVLGMKNQAKVYGGTFGNTVNANLANPKNISSHVTVDVSGVEASQLLPALAVRFPQKSLKTFAGGLSGKGNLKVDATAAGDPAEITKNLSADISANFVNGRLTVPLFGKMTSSLHKIYSAVPDLHQLDFKTFKAQARLRQGNLEFQDISVDGDAFGSVNAAGKVGLDQTLAMKADVHLPKAASAPILAGGAAATGYLKGLGLPATVAPASDKDKRVIVSYLIGGTLQDPTFKADVPRLSDLAKGAASMLLDEKKKEAQALVDRKKAELQTRAETEKKKVQTQVQTKVDNTVKQTQEKAKDKAKSEIGKKLKGFGF